MSHEKLILVLKARAELTPRVLRLSFERADGDAFAYLPGQFLTLHLPWQEMVLRRSYSIASIPDGAASRCIEIAATRIEGGRASGVLEALEEGERIEATGPFGRFVLRDDPPSRYLLVATGTGVSPYRAMLPQLRERLRIPGFSAILMLGVRSRPELLYGGDFSAFAETVENFRFLPSFSRERPEEIPAAHHGYVQERLSATSLDSARDIVYLCGNPDMIDDAVAHLKLHGFSNPHIRREKYVSSN
ncbi:MAG TPA: FAD-binding oxidoreductase [Gammaproteobacteria bacterium]|nr:FAD-binding oxidoreductase [Gammaproteobacteria bacterium]